MLSYRKIRKFKKNAKALSPVVASIILIAVTVAVSVVVAAWMSGMTIGLMGNAEQVAITNIQYNSAASCNITVQNTGSAPVTLSSATIDGKTVTITNSTGAAPWTIAKGDSATLKLTNGADFTTTAQYTIKLQTAKGNTITNTYTYTGQ
jgi:flagellin-like protein